MLNVTLLKVFIFLAVAQLRFVYSQWWDDYNSQYYSAYSHMGYPCPYSQESYDYSSYGQVGYPYTTYLITGNYADYEQMYGPHYTDATQPIIIVVENVDDRDEFYIDDLISLSLGLVKNLPNDYSSSCSSSCNSYECRNKGRQNYEFYSDCNRGPKCSCDSCRSNNKKSCKKSCRKSGCGCQCDSDSYCDCGCCKHIVICECY